MHIIYYILKNKGGILMLGVIVNTATIIAGGAIGLLVKNVELQ